jgi:ElaB/YqjD/DUF883 family membrane-anchored ribosome-binding protein
MEEINSPHNSTRRRALGPDPIEELVERLSHIGQSKPKFKAPKYTGDSDIELFLSQFLDVSDANRWSDREAALHLRSSLEGSAAACGQSSDLEEIISDLRARFGITSKQARSKLGSISRKSKQTFHELGAEVTRLVKIAYPRQDRQFQLETSLEIFSRALNHRTLQQHLLARPHDTMAEAVQICNEFMQVEGSKPTIANIDAEEGEQPETSRASTEIQLLLSTVKELMQSQSQLLKDLAQSQSKQDSTPRRKVECFNCGGPHLRRNCPKLKAQNTDTVKQSENSDSPAQ